MIVFSIDPGKKGAVVVFSGNEIVDHLLLKDSGYGVLLVDLVELFDTWKPDLVLIEQPPTMPNQSVRSTGVQFFIFGQLQAISETFCNRVEFISPQTWTNFVKRLSNDEKALNARSKSQVPKSLSKAVAAQFYPKFVEDIKGPRGGIPDGLTDAVCIFIYHSRDNYLHLV